MNAIPPTISIILPAYNEQFNIPPLIKAITTEMLACDVPYEIIVIDDGSSDDTWAILSQMEHNAPYKSAEQLQGLRLSRNFGKEAAIFAGLEAAKGQAVIVMDCDLQHPPELIPKMIRLWQETQIDVVDAVKSHRGDEPWIRRFCSTVFYSLFKSLSGHDLKNSSDFKLLDRTVVDALLGMNERSMFFRGMVEWLGCKRNRLTFEVQNRRAGASGWPTRRLIKMAVETITAYSFIPLRLIAITGVLFLFAAVLLSFYTLIYKLLGLAISGFTTVILLQLIIGSACMLSIGIIGEYVARIYEEVKHRPRYLVARRLLFRRQQSIEKNEPHP